MDVTSSITYQITVTDRQLKIINLALGHLCFPEKIKPSQGSDRQEAWELNKQMLLLRKNQHQNNIARIDAALAKADELEEQNKIEFAEMH